MTAPRQQRALAGQKTGWAVIDNGYILVRTVSDTRRAAIVNWLGTERNCFISIHMTDEQIERLWFQFRTAAVDVEHVTISRTNETAR